MVGAVIVGLIVGILIGSLISSLILMPTLRLMINDQSDFGYVFKTVLPAMIVGTIANLGIEFVMASAQEVEFGQARGNWFNLPIALAVMTFFISKRHEATVLKSFLAALINQVVMFVLGFIIVMLLTPGSA